MQKECTIVFYIGWLYKGGAERVVVNLADYFHQQGWKVYIVTPKKHETEYKISDGIDRVISDLADSEVTGSRIKNLRARIRKLRQVFMECKPNVIVSFLGKNNFMAIQAAKPLGIPVVVSVRSDPQREYKNFAMRVLVKPMFKRASGVILQTQEAMNYFPQSIRKKSVILPNSLKPAFVKPYYDGERIPVIVTAGRFDDNKNQILLIKAFQEIAADYPQVELRLYGEGPAQSKWEQYISENISYNIASRIHFMGVRDNLEELIYQDSIFVLTSIVEGMPNALIEAMALGLAVISTDCPCGGPRELIGNNENGILIKSYTDPRELADALRRVLSDKKLAWRLSQNAYRKTREYLPEVVNAQWREYLQSLMKDS